MAWPYDARDKSYSANVEVPSSNLNEIQDQIQLIAGIHYKDLLTASVSGTGARSNSGWDFSGAGTLWLPIPSREGARISVVEIKYFNKVASANWVASVYEIGMDISTPSNAPSSTQLATLSDNSLGADTWGVLTLNSGTAGGGGTMPVILDLGDRAEVRVTVPSNGDVVAGVRVTYTQFY